MPAKQPVVSHLAIQAGGEDLAPAVLRRVLEVTVDQHVYLPAMFSIRLFDPGMKLLDDGPFDLAKPVKIGAKSADDKIVTLIDGEITALEPEFGEGMIAELTIRGYDKSHLLYRERKSKTYLNSKDSDLAQEIAQKANLQADIEKTATVYEHIYQHNQSDLRFLQHRAWRIGFVCYVENGTLHFRPPKLGRAGVTLAWGKDSLTFRPSLAVAEQARETHVRGWDVQKKAPVLGRAAVGNLYPKIADSKNGSDWTQSFGANRQVIVNQPVVSQAEADILATARQNDISGTFLEAEGEVFRRPDVQAGRTVKIEGLGKRLSGDYLVTNAMHIYTDEGLKTRFCVTGARTGLLVNLFEQAPNDVRWGGVVPAVVTNADDPNNWGRVKVKFPWMADDEESAWARVLSTGGGPKSGLAVIPAVDDEVMVAFQHGDFACPVVLGGLWNGVDALPVPVADATAGEKPLVRSWHSRTGHHVTLYDNADNKLEVVTSGGHRLVLDDTGTKMLLKSSGGLEILLEDNSRKISISGGDIEVTAQANLTVKGQTVKLEASGQMELQAGGQVNVKGAMINLG